MLSSCQPAPSHLLEKAMQMENVSTDSIFFYLQQIEEPDKLPLNDQGDYYLLLYKATLWKTGTPDDSLLQIAQALLLLTAYFSFKGQSENGCPFLFEELTKGAERT